MTGIPGETEICLMIWGGDLVLGFFGNFFNQLAQGRLVKFLLDGASDVGENLLEG